MSILGQTSNSSGETWYEVKFSQSGASGWVRSDFVAIANASTSEPSVSEPKSSSSPSVEQANNLPSCVKSDCNCSDFSSRAEAERVLAAYPNDPFGLDRDKDGIPCEKLR
ncbi:excalibur calcium-binding domain-containing protein [Cyanobacteria bacterium FACHB-63]|nr:excalibur calcium-binding domain-containing protein [Cyanobacteria bacterium FACHB-63]